MSDAHWEHLPRAPITEALIDLRVKLPDETGLARLGEFKDAVADAYPGSRERRRLHGQLTFSGEDAPVLSAQVEGPDGYILTSADGMQVVQGRLDGFTFSRLKPYENWERLRDSAKSLWMKYRETARPVSVERLAVRYINRLELPLPVGELRHWILTVPEIARGLPQGLDGFVMRLHVRFTDPTGYVNITQTGEPKDYDKVVPLIFDIDAFRLVDLEPSDQAIWSGFQDLRQIKNMVFFKSVTDKFLELCR